MGIRKKSDLIDPRAVLPRTEAVLMIQEANRQLSQSSGQPMVVFKLKALSPDAVETPNGTKASVAGREITHYISFSDKAIGGSLSVYEQLSNTTVPDEFDDEAVQEALVDMAGKVFNGRIYSEPYFETEPGTRKNVLGEDGKPIVKGYSTRLADVLTPVRELTDPAP